ncbi:MAG TPA: hypothetical protein VNN21_02985 [Dehalococcoidia bacterium]|nr:hypothetical protein [Dehalococcoidia bacterium]
MAALHSPRLRALVLWAARLVIVAYVFQVAAFDHWHTDIGDVVGIENSQEHALHCHGNAGGCSDTVSAATSLPAGSYVPASPPVVSAAAAVDQSRPKTVSIEAPATPPRSV